MKLDTYKLQTQTDLLEKWGHYENPVISIVCTTYNHESFIDECMRGFFIQDTQYPFEILVHDDASTDRTQAIIKHWQSNYPKIIRTIFRKENLYSQGKRRKISNRETLKGKYVIKCEGDDYWCLPDKLEKQVFFLENNHEYIMCFHNSITRIEGKDLYIKGDCNLASDFALDQESLMTSRVNGKPIFARIPTILYRTKLFDEKEFYCHERYNQKAGDRFQTSLLGFFGKGMYFGGYYGAVFRQNNQSSWSPISADKKSLRRSETFFWLSKFYQRNNYDDIADYWAKLSQDHLNLGLMKPGQQIRKKYFIVGLSLGIFDKINEFYKCEIGFSEDQDLLIKLSETQSLKNISSTLQHLKKPGVYSSPLFSIPDVCTELIKHHKTEGFIFLDTPGEHWFEIMLSYVSKQAQKPTSKLTLLDIYSLNNLIDENFIKIFLENHPSDSNLILHRSELIEHYNNYHSEILNTLNSSGVMYVRITPG